MSVFRPATIPCPACGAGVQFEEADSVNGARRPDLREEILQDSFQRGTCPSCTTEFRLDPALTYLDVERGQWMLIRPASDAVDWRPAVDHAREIYDEAFGPATSSKTRAIGAKLQMRVAFGWAAAREKLLCAAHGLDDVELELLKLALIRWLGDAPLADDIELRLVDVEPELLRMAWIASGSGQVFEPIEVPRSLYEDVRSDRAGWDALRAELGSSTYVDMNRLLVEPEEDTATA